MTKSTGTKNETRTESQDSEDSLPPGKGNRLLFLAAALMLITFAIIPLIYQVMEFQLGREREKAVRSFLQGMALARDGRAEEARALFEGMRAREDRSGMALTGLAYLRLLQGDRKGAEVLWDQALSQDPMNPFARALRQQALDGAGPARVEHALESLARGDRPPPADSPGTGTATKNGGISPRGP